ncbi:hypothetical protein [Tardiphaga robiniae]|uniref:Uncharacterized protein n=1 Tax=Tardiphaga robiniae TaxID=943830 RepID=A0A7G6TVG8_9BRAD|nr:hypothetical protein [Tardiphaga robiniae]QND70750.1 hypothetical protein HB776_05515 [Tardiphaga robiniae]
MDAAYHARKIMVLLVWGIFLMIALIPGGIVGWLIGRIPLPVGWCVLLALGVSGAAGFVVSNMRMSSPNATAKYHFENAISLFGPPILAAMLLGLFIARRMNVSSRPSHVAPEDWHGDDPRRR